MNPISPLPAKRSVMQTALVLLGRVGYQVRINAGFVGDLLGLFILTLKQSRQLLHPARRRVFWMLFKRQIFNTGFKATYVNCALALLFGGVMAGQLSGLIANPDSFADLYVIVIVLELAPLISGIILIARSATAVTSEISHLQLNDEFELLQSQGINPLFIFMLPIFFAFPASLLIMLIYFNVAALIGTWLYFQLFSPTDLAWVELLDAVMKQMTLMGGITLLIKAIVGGIVIGLVSLYSGWQVKERFTDIAKAISNSTTSLLLIYFVLNLGLSVLAY